MASRFERKREEVLNRNATAQAHEMALAELKAAGIDPNTSAGREFMFRVRAFGIMGTQPPRPEFNAHLKFQTLDRF